MIVPLIVGSLAQLSLKKTYEYSFSTLVRKEQAGEKPCRNWREISTMLRKIVFVLFVMFVLISRFSILVL